MSMPAYLPLSNDQDTLLTTLRQGYTVTWATPAFLGRLRNLKLVDTSGDAPALTVLGAVVAVVADVALRCRLTTNAVKGIGARSGARLSRGTSARCSCGAWKWHTTENGAEGKRRARAAHALHMAEEIETMLAG